MRYGKNIVLLITVMLFIVIFVCTGFAAQPEAPEETIIVKANEKAVITLAEQSFGIGNLQWQIYSKDYGAWTAIRYAVENDFIVSQATLGSALDADGSVNLRCIYGDKRGERVVYSAQVIITDDTLQEQQPEERSVNETKEPTPDIFEKFAVTISYLYEDGALVCPSSCCHFTPGIDVNWIQEVRILPRYSISIDNDNADVSQEDSSINIRIPEIDRNYNILVMYIPEKVEYTVLYYLQNIQDNSYTSEEEIRTAQIDSFIPTPLDRENREGFSLAEYTFGSAKPNQPSSAVVYYDRNYYLTGFVSNAENESTNPIYTKYGDKLGIVNQPEKENYIFEGWCTVPGCNGVNCNAEKYSSDELVSFITSAGNKTYYANWKENKNTRLSFGHPFSVRKISN